MVSEEKYIVGLRKHIFAAPNAKISMLIFIVAAFVVAYPFHQSVYDVVLLFIAPYLLASALDYLTIRFLRIYFPMSRVSMLNIFAFAVAYIQFVIIYHFFGFYMGFYLSFSSVILPRLMIYRTFLSERKYYSLLVSVYYSAIIFLISIIFFSYQLFPFIIASASYVIIGFLMLRISTAPFRREFKEDPLFFISSLVNYMARLGREDVAKLNKFFYGIYEDREVPISTMVFRNKNGVKAVFVAPYIHPGPFGEVGGSDISTKLEKSLGMDNLMVFHTTTTHDNNVATEEDVSKIADAVRELMDGDCESDKMSTPIRFSIGSHGVMAHRFGDYAFVALLPEHAEFDDVELNSGIAIMKSLRGVFKDVMCIDAHNNFDENAQPLSLTRGDVHKIGENMKNLKNEFPIKMGYAAVEFNGHSIGPGGIRAAVFDCKTKLCGYVLVDGNNISQGLRNKIRENLKDLAEVEVFSTDNHVVNVTMMDLNPVGNEDDWDSIVKKSREVVQEAIGNMEYVCVHMRTKWIKLRMAASGQLAKMTDITKESIQVAKFAVPILSVLGFALAFLTFYYFSS